MDYKIRVNRPCRLFIDGEEIQVLNELQLTKIELAPGEYLRKVVAIDNPSIFDETVLSISSYKVDLITLDTTGLEDARCNALPEGEFLVGNLYYMANEDNTGVFVSQYDKNVSPAELIIPDTIYYAGYRYSVTSIGEQAFSRCSSLTSITIPNSVTSIGEQAFYECKSFTSINVDVNNLNYCSVDGVLFNKDKTTLIQCPKGKQGAYTIPNSVTSIGERAFAYCSKLTSVTIGNSVTSIGDYAFYECSSLTSVTIGNSVTSIGNYAVDGCASLTSITIPNSVKSIGWCAFYNCSSLTSVTIGNSVTSIGWAAFGGCKSLTSITIPNSVTSIGWAAFDGCSSLTSAKYTGTKEQWNKIELSHSWAKESGIEVIHCTDGEIRL